MGDYNRLDAESSEQEIGVKTIIRHNDKKLGVRRDVAILVLNETATLQNTAVSVIKMATREAPYGEIINKLFMIKYNKVNENISILLTY